MKSFINSVNWREQKEYEEDFNLFLYFCWHSRGANERAPCNGLLFDRFGLRTRPIENFEEIGGFGPHARMNVSFATFNVVMQVVAEQVDQIDRVVPHVLIRVAREKN